MAPKAGTKRAASASKGTQATKAQKKTEEKKVEEVPKYSDPRMEGLVDAVQRADLPIECKDMLILMIPSSFGAPVEERHELQGMAVQMVGEVIEQMQAERTKGFDEAKAVLEAAESKKVELTRAVEESENLLNTAKETVLSKEKGLQEAAKAMTEKQELLVNSKEAQKKSEEELVSVQAEREVLASSVTDSFKLLCSSDLEGHEAVQHFKVMQPYIPKLDLDDSLIIALPSTCQKKASERGPFDNVVMEQLENALQARISSLEGKVANADVTAAEHAAAIQAAEEELISAKQAHETAEKDLAEAQTKSQTASESLKGANEAVNVITAEVDAAGKACIEKETCCSKFESWNLSCFTQLKDKSLVSMEVAESAERDLAQPAVTEPVLAEPAPAILPMEVAASSSKEMPIEAVSRTLVCQAGA